MTVAAPRYAVYWAPEPGHPLWAAGCDWLGRDAARPLAPTREAEHREAPRRYGFHATLKAPMALRDGAEPAAFLAAVAHLAARTPPFAMPALRVGWLSGFLALLPATAMDAAHPLRRLADACVAELDGWRPAQSEAQWLRRSAGLEPERQAMVRRFGYPHVFEHWRFHMTLSNCVPPESTALRDRLFRRAGAHFDAALALPLSCESLSVFVETAEGEPFVLAHRFPLAA